MNGLATKMRYMPINIVYKTIDWLGKKQIRYAFCADSNFGIVERDVDIAKYLEKTKYNYGYPEKFRVCFAKNSLNRNIRIREILSRSGLSKSIIISFQSRSFEALKSIKRTNVSLKEFYNFVSICEKNIPTYTEFILGFSGETYDSFLNEIREILNAKAHNEIFVYLCSILPNTYTASLQFQKKYEIKKKKIPLNEIHYIIYSDPSPENHYPDVYAPELNFLDSIVTRLKMW